MNIERVCAQVKKGAYTIRPKIHKTHIIVKLIFVDLSMRLRKQVMDILNGDFQKAGFPMKIDKIFFYRPTYFESYHENLEVLDDVSRLYDCDFIYLLIEFHHEDLWYEYEMRFKNNGNELQNTICILKYWELMSEEDLEVAELRMTPFTRLLAAHMIPSVLHLLYEKKNRD